MFLWRSLTPSAIASAAAALTRGKPAAPAKETAASTVKAPAAAAPLPADRIAKS